MAADKKEYCGVFGIYGDTKAVDKTYFGLHSLQHRGQESAGIASSDGQSIIRYAGMGNVQRVFRDKNVLKKLKNRTAIGHVRYSTTGSSVAANAQPMLMEYSRGQVAVAHNGNLINASLLRDEYEAYGHIFSTTGDTEIIIHLLAKPSHVAKPDPVGHVLRHLQGAFSLLFLFPNKIEAARDPFGIRPLCIGRTEEGAYVVASETCALDAIDAEYIRDVEPGEIVTLDENGLHSRFYMDKSEEVKPAHCIFEHVYFAKQNSRVFGDSVHECRKKMGEMLAIEHPVEADVVTPVPDSGTSAAIGFANKSGIPLDMAFVRSHYIGRSFISPSQELRDLAVKLKLSVVKEAVNGKRVVVVDDSVVRGTTTKGKINQLRQAGAKEIHLRISCPPIRYPCFYGVDFPTKEELLANNRTMEEIRDYLEVDSIGYISLDGLLKCASKPADHYCTACWSGKYKIPVSTVVNKFAMERSQMHMFEETD